MPAQVSFLSLVVLGPGPALRAGHRPRRTGRRRHAHGPGGSATAHTPQRGGQRGDLHRPRHRRGGTYTSLLSHGPGGSATAHTPQRGGQRGDLRRPRRRRPHALSRLLDQMGSCTCRHRRGDRRHEEEAHEGHEGHEGAEETEAGTGNPSQRVVWSGTMALTPRGQEIKRTFSGDVFHGHALTPRRRGGSGGSSMDFD